MNKFTITGVCIVLVGLVNLFTSIAKARVGDTADLRRIRYLRIVAFIAIPAGILLIYLAGHWQILK
jgi:hypothetical protein